MPARQWPKYTWDENARQYRGEDGRFVARPLVRQALDEAIDSAKAEITKVSRQLQAGQVSLIEWQLAMEKSLKTIHVMSTAAAAGGWAQVTPADWSIAGNRIKDQYAWLERFAVEIANGLPLDGRFLRRDESYANSGSGTYEKVLRRIDMATGLVIAERRRLHSGSPCGPCYAYFAAGWQSPGVLPDVGEECECFPAGTMIETEEGPKPIEDIRVGDRVLTRSGYRSVATLFRSSHVGPLKVVEAGGQRAACTPNHPFWTQRGWVQASQLVADEDYVSLMKGNRFSMHRVSAVFDDDRR